MMHKAPRTMAPACWLLGLPGAPSTPFLKLSSPDSQAASPRPLPPVLLPTVHNVACSPGFILRPSCLRLGLTGRSGSREGSTRGISGASPRGLLPGRGRVPGQLRECRWEHGHREVPGCFLRCLQTLDRAQLQGGTHYTSEQKAQGHWDQILTVPKNEPPGPLSPTHLQTLRRLNLGSTAEPPKTGERGARQAGLPGAPPLQQPQVSPRATCVRTEPCRGSET